MRILARSTVYGCNPETDVNKTALKYTWFAERNIVYLQTKPRELVTKLSREAILGEV